MAEEKTSQPQEVDNRTRLQAKRELHAKKQAERLEKVETLKAAYVASKDDPALLDILEKAKAFKEWHNKLAIDGVGARKIGVDDSGADIIEDYYLTDSQIARELGGTSALQQLITYIENKLN
jgi:hypothetical protein